MATTRFRNRTEAGRRLADALADYADRDDVIVLGLPRGGVPVAFEVARALRAPLDVFIVRKLGLPWHEELAMGAIATGGVRMLNQEVVQAYGLEDRPWSALARREVLGDRFDEFDTRGPGAGLEPGWVMSSPEADAVHG